MSDLDNLMELTLDDLDDLPSFAPFPPGSHRVLATFEQKEIKGTAAITLTFKYIENIDLGDSNDKAPNENDTCNTVFMLNNEYGIGNFKKCAAPFSKALQLTRLGDIVEQVTDIECAIVTSLRTDKNDASRKYLNVLDIGIV